MHTRGASPFRDDSTARQASPEPADSSGAVTPTESIVSQDLPVVNVNLGDVAEDTHDGSFAEGIGVQLAELDLSDIRSDRLRTPSTARDLYNATPRASLSPEPHRRDRGRRAQSVLRERDNDQTEDDLVNGVRKLSLGNFAIPYDVGSEDLPPEPFFQKDFQRCLNSGRGIANAVHTTLAQCSLSTHTGSELSHLRDSANALRSFASPATRLVGIVGDSAAGKSSLINSLLNIPDLAHKGDHGSAVTSFVTEYRCRSAQHTMPFTIEAEYCNKDEIDDQLQELLVSYRELYQPGLGKELEDNEQQYREIERKSEIAFSTLQSIFPDCPKVTSEKLQGNGDGAFKRILDRLRRLAKKIQWPSGAADGKWTATAASSAECHEKVAYFMQNGLWPLTNINIDLALAEKKYESIGSSEEAKKAWEERIHEFDNGSPASSQRAELKYKYLYIAARNAAVKRVLKKRYAVPDIGMAINVFCVGNRDYEGADFRSQEARNMAVHGSCVPELRRFCHSIVARAQHRASMHFLEVEIPSLIESLEVWLSVAQQKCPTAIDPQIVLDLESGLKQILAEYVEALETAVLDHVLNTMCSYKAFCRNNGDHCTAAIGARSWNAELLGNMNTLMSINWSALQSQILKLRNGLQTSVIKDCKRATRKFKAFEAPDSFLASFRLKERELRYLIRNTCSAISDEIRIIETNARGDHISSFILDLMNPTYRECAMQNGPGTMARMHRIMKTRLDKRDIFGLIQTRIEDEAQNRVDDNVDGMLDGIADICESIRRQVAAFTDPQVEAQMNNPEEVEKVRKQTDEARAQMLELQLGLERLKRARTAADVVNE
ncbi:MAG: hypothetical protein LQ341_002975 [Variospora aurantia]|nr:MAG: hypothetical protein LQ341_002975 [Variospora aurantia]